MMTYVALHCLWSPALHQAFGAAYLFSSSGHQLMPLCIHEPLLEKKA